MSLANAVYRCLAKGADLGMDGVQILVATMTDVK
jgi:hypothetical protein